MIAIFPLTYPSSELILSREAQRFLPRTTWAPISAPQHWQFLGILPRRSRTACSSNFMPRFLAEERALATPTVILARSGWFLRQRRVPSTNAGLMHRRQMCFSRPRLTPKNSVDAGIDSLQREQVRVPLPIAFFLQSLQVRSKMVWEARRRTRTKFLTVGALSVPQTLHLRTQPASVSCRNLLDNLSFATLTKLVTYTLEPILTECL